MLALGTDPTYRGMLATSYKFYVRLEVWRAGVRVDTFGDFGLPKQTGTINATLQSRVARTLNLTVPSQFAPDDIEDPDYLLSPLNKEIRAFASYANGFFEFPLFRGRIQTLQYDSSSDVSLTCSDLAQDIVMDPFPAPRKSNAGTPLRDQYVNLVTDTLIDASFSGIDVFYQVMPDLTWQTDRGAACDDVATAGHGYWYALADGSFTLKKAPWTVIADPVASFVNGEGGSLIKYQVSADRSNVFNQMTVTAERADSSAPVYATVQDTDPTSPTYILGDFGRQGSTVSVQSALSQGQAQSIARQYLASSRAFKQTWTASLPPDASLELGDPLLLQDRTGRSSTQVLSNFSMPVTGDGQMSCQFRAQIPEGADVNE